jgi:3'(2'), 5'-bisphosphate nucleotidase
MNEILDNIITTTYEIGRKAEEIRLGGHIKVLEKFQFGKISSVTNADIAGHEIAIKNLSKFNIPIISEEGPTENNLNIVRTSKSFFLIDPIDDTDGYIAGRGGSVNIALIEHGKPLLSAVLYMKDKKMFFYDGNNSYVINSGKADILEGAVIGNQPRKIAVSRNSGDMETSFLKEKFGLVMADYEKQGHIQKFMGFFEGKFDTLLTSFGYSMWDIAAQHGILLGMGADVFCVDMKKPDGQIKPLRYIEGCLDTNKNDRELIENILALNPVISTYNKLAQRIGLDNSLKK